MEPPRPESTAWYGVLSIEGRKYGIRVMGLAPNAVTRMRADVPGTKDSESYPILRPENVAPGMLFMTSELAACRFIGAG